MRRRRRNTWTLLVALSAATAFVASQAIQAPGATSLPKPTAGWENPVLVSTTQAHRETSLALNPVNPNNMAVCDPSGVPNTANGQSYFHRSTDGGLHWTFMKVETAATDPRKAAFEGGDCDVAFDKGGTMYSADTWLGDLSVGHSTDGGATWDGTPLAVTSPIVDRPWLVGGPAGTIHVSYEDLQCCMPSAIWYTRSTDGGVTFLPAVPVADAGPDGTYTWEGNFVVSTDGKDLYLVYTRRNANNATTGLDDVGPEKVFVAASHDSGLTWTSHLVAAMPKPASYLYPSIAMDQGGWLHVVFASMTDVDRPIWYSYSKDKAQTWSPATPLTRGAAGFSPWIAAGAQGQAAVTWYGNPDPTQGPTGSGDWYFYWARVAIGDDGVPAITAGTTTQTPIYKGSATMAEFENVRLDADGAMHLGMSSIRAGKWSVWYQRECPPPGSASPVPAECVVATPTPTPTP
ncbi:MAG: sialidase family protein [Actinomycetota bacterium]